MKRRGSVEDKSASTVDKLGACQETAESSAEAHSVLSEEPIALLKRPFEVAVSIHWFPIGLGIGHWMQGNFNATIQTVVCAALRKGVADGGVSLESVVGTLVSGIGGVDCVGLSYGQILSLLKAAETRATPFTLRILYCRKHVCASRLSLELAERKRCAAERLLFAQLRLELGTSARKRLQPSESQSRRPAAGGKAKRRQRRRSRSLCHTRDGGDVGSARRTRRKTWPKSKWLESVKEPTHKRGLQIVVRRCRKLQRDIRREKKLLAQQSADSCKKPENGEHFVAVATEASGRLQTFDCVMCAQCAWFAASLLAHSLLPAFSSLAADCVPKLAVDALATLRQRCYGLNAFEIRAAFNLWKHFASCIPDLCTAAQMQSAHACCSYLKFQIVSQSELLALQPSIEWLLCEIE